MAIDIMALLQTEKQQANVAPSVLKTENHSLESPSRFADTLASQQVNHAAVGSHAKKSLDAQEATHTTTAASAPDDVDTPVVKTDEAHSDKDLTASTDHDVVDDQAKHTDEADTASDSYVEQVDESSESEGASKEHESKADEASKDKTGSAHAEDQKHQSTVDSSDAIKTNVQKNVDPSIAAVSSAAETKASNAALTDKKSATKAAAEVNDKPIPSAAIKDAGVAQAEGKKIDPALLKAAAGTVAAKEAIQTADSKKSKVVEAVKTTAKPVDGVHAGKVHVKVEHVQTQTDKPVQAAAVAKEPAAINKNAENKAEITKPDILVRASELKSKIVSKFKQLRDAAGTEVKDSTAKSDAVVVTNTLKTDKIDLSRQSTLLHLRREQMLSAIKGEKVVDGSQAPFARAVQNGSEQIQQGVNATLQQSINQNLIKDMNTMAKAQISPLLQESKAELIQDSRQSVSTQSVSSSASTAQLNQALNAAQAKPMNLMLSLQQGNPSQQLSERIMMMVGKGMTQATLRLDPPELGALMIRINLGGEGANIQFTSQNQDIRQILQDQADRLRDLLQEEGLSLGNLDVSNGEAQESESDDDAENLAGQGSNDSVLTPEEDVLSANRRQAQSGDLGLGYYV